MPTPAAIAFFALGANALGTAAVLVVGFESRAVRWFTPFQAVLLAWLLTLGMIQMGGTGEAWMLARRLTGSLLPGTFVASSVMAYETVRPRWGLIVLATTVFVAVLSAGWMGREFDSAWQVVGWTSGIALVVHHARSSSGPGNGSGVRGVVVGLLVVVPMAAVLGVLFDAGSFFEYGMPLLTVAMQVLLLVGIVRARLYHLEVRVSRVGQLGAVTLETERLAILGTLAASLAHEVRNPLTGVRSLAQRVRDDTLEDERRREYADVIVREADRVSRLLERMLGVSGRKPSSGQSVEHTDLHTVLEDVALLAGPKADAKGVAFLCDAAGHSATVSREALTQVLLNLVLNGIEHTPAGGRVTVEARRDMDGIALQVADQGPGIAAEDRASVFEPYWSSEGGTGIGLSVVKQLAEDHGWRVSVHDSDGGGALVRVFLPDERGS